MRTGIIAGSALALAVTCSVGTAAPALADESTSGPESATGLLVVTSGANGARQVLYSEISMHGVFDGVGRIVEIDNLPGDPATVNRDELVFPQGTISVKSTNQDVSIDVDPQTCVATAKLTQTTEITAGTGLFDDATGTFDATVNGLGLLPRAADGTCDQNAGPVFEVDRLQLTGRMSLQD